jgi:hypothetical protein
LRRIEPDGDVRGTLIAQPKIFRPHRTLPQHRRNLYVAPAIDIDLKKFPVSQITERSRALWIGALLQHGSTSVTSWGPNDAFSKMQELWIPLWKK